MLAASIAAGTNLVYNGGFELLPDSGWKQLAWGDFADTGNCRVRRTHAFHPDRDYELMLHKMLHQGLLLSQRLEFEDLDLGFALSARLTSKTERESLFAAASVGLQFLGSGDSVLGETRVYSATAGCDWRSGPALHLVRAPDSLSWYDYRLDVPDELASLPGVVPESVRALRVVVQAFVLGNC